MVVVHDLAPTGVVQDEIGLHIGDELWEFEEKKIEKLQITLGKSFLEDKFKNYLEE